MSSLPPESDTPAAETERTPLLQRGHNRLALIIVLVLHLLLLLAALVSRSRAPTMPAADRSTEVVVYAPPPQEKKEPPPPPPEPVKLPPQVTPEMPKIEIVPDAVVPAPVAAPPAPVSAPATAKPAPAPTAPPPPPPPPAAEPPAIAKQLFAECADTPNRRMVADVFQLPTTTTSFKAMDRRKPIKRVCLSQLNVEPRDFTEGFPGLDLKEWFGLDVRFTVTVAQDGDWDVMVLSDDGSSLSIDNKVILTNDGIHAPGAVFDTVSLSKGVHNFRVRYFQGPGPSLALMLAWKKAGTKDYVLIPQSVLGRPPVESQPELKAN